MLLHQKFKIQDRVKIHSTKSNIDGYTGVIGGYSYTNIFVCYIVILDSKFELNGENHLAFSIPGQCLSGIATESAL